MRSDAEDSRQQQPIQQRYYDEAWNDWNSAKVGHVYTVDNFIFLFARLRCYFFVIYLVYRFREKVFRETWKTFLCFCRFIGNVEFLCYRRITA